MKNPQEFELALCARCILQLQYRKRMLITIPTVLGIMGTILIPIFFVSKQGVNMDRALPMLLVMGGVLFAVLLAIWVPYFIVRRAPQTLITRLRMEDVPASTFWRSLLHSPPNWHMTSGPLMKSIDARACLSDLAVRHSGLGRGVLPKRDFDALDAA